MKDKDLKVEMDKYENKYCLRDKSSLLVACHLPTYGIGYKGDLLYHIKDDLRYFMRITKNNIVVMGRGTWESLPKKPLKNRLNIIISNNNYDILDKEINDNKYENTVVIKNFKLLLEYLKKNSSDMKIYYIGGESIYKYVVDNDLIDNMLITEIKSKDNLKPNIDTYFDYSNYNEYKLIEKSDIYIERYYEYVFTQYKRII
jgi:dihydrofolate reductase